MVRRNVMLTPSSAVAEPRATPRSAHAVIVACVLVFLWQLLGPGMQAAIYGYGLVPDALLNAPPPQEIADTLAVWMTLFTSMFVHASWAHLVANLVCLWLFAGSVEGRLGHGRFVVLYVLCGIAATLAQALFDPNSQARIVGASGAISGVLGAYLLIDPRARLVVLIPLGHFSQLIRLPAMTVLALWFAMQLLSEMGTAAPGAGVAHIGGFVAGLALLPLLRHHHEATGRSFGAQRPNR